MTVPDPEPYRAVVFRNAVLQEKVVHIPLEGDKEIEEILIPVHRPGQGTFLATVVPADTFEGQIPPVPYQGMRPLHLIDAAAVLRENDHTADGV